MARLDPNLGTLILPEFAHGTRVTFADGTTSQCGRSGRHTTNFGYSPPAVTDALGRLSADGAAVPLEASSDATAELTARLTALVRVNGAASVTWGTEGSFARHLLRGVDDRVVIVRPPIVPTPEQTSERQFVDGSSSDRSDRVVVVDETLSGWFRTGPRFAHLAWEPAPDAVLVGGALTNGMTNLAALVTNDRAAHLLHRTLALISASAAELSPIHATIAGVVCSLARSVGADANAVYQQGLDRLRDHESVAFIVGGGWAHRIGVIGGPAPPDLVERARRCGVWAHPDPAGLLLTPPVISTSGDAARILEAIGDTLDGVR